MDKLSKDALNAAQERFRLAWASLPQCDREQIQREALVTPHGPARAKYVQIAVGKKLAERARAANHRAGDPRLDVSATQAWEHFRECQIKRKVKSNTEGKV